MNFAKNYIARLANGLSKIPPQEFEKIGDILINACDNNQQVFIFGNGGSASTASHMACDLAKGTVLNISDPRERRIKAAALTDNTALISALANDIGYAHVFSEQLKNFIQPGDIAIGISASGNSLNVLNALSYAKKIGATTIGFIGFDGGKMKELCDHCLHFEENSYQLSEDAHLIFQHIITSYVAYKRRDKETRAQSAHFAAPEPI